MTAPSLHPTADIASLDAQAREDLRAYAELGGFTLTPETHAWYAAVDTVAGSEEARAASTVLAELRGRDLPVLVAAARRLGEAEALGIDAPGTVAETRRAVSLLLRVRLTLRTLSADAYDVPEPELDDFLAATASGTWRRERGLKVTWLRRRSLRGRVRGLVSGRPRRDAVHTALASAATERTDWAALGGTGRPAVPADADFLDEASHAAEAAATGLTELGRLLRPEAALDTLAFDELARLLDRLAADEGTLYRLPNLKATRDRLVERGLGAVLTELTERRADHAEVVALLGEADTAAVPEPRTTSEAEVPAGEPDSESGSGAVAAPEALSAEAEVPAAEPVTEPEPVAEAVVEPVPVKASPAVEAPAVEPVAPAEAESVVEAASVEEPELEPEPVAGAASVEEPEPVAEVVVEAQAESVVEAASDKQPEAEPVVESVAEAAEEAPAVEPVASAEAESVVEAASVEEPEPVAEAVAPAAPVASAEEPEPVSEVPVVAPEPVAEVVVEAQAESVVEAASVEEPDPVVETASVEEPEPVSEMPAAAPEPVAEVVVAVEAEPVVESVSVEAPEAEPVVEPVSVEEPKPEPEPVAEAVEEPEAPVAASEPVAAEVGAEAAPASGTPAVESGPGQRPGKPAVTPGKSVTAYAADELTALVRWIDGDGEQRSDDELLRAAMKELGFARLGPRIKEALGAAVAEVRG